MSAIIFNNNVLSSIMIIIGFLLVFLFYKDNINKIVFYIKPKENKLSKLSKFLHRYYNLFFIILFLISLISFSIIYFYHSKNIEKRFDNSIQSYEKSISNIFNNLSISTNNQTNESIVSNNGTTSSCTSTRDRISINNNNIMNMISSEGDGFDELKKAFEIGLDLLKASLSETMKNSNDVLTFWFAFLSVIMVVFSFAGYFINNNILEQSKYQLKMVEKEAEQSIKNIKVETQKLIDENNKYIRISQLFNFGEDSGKNKDYNSVIKYNLEIIKLYGDINNIKDKNHINNYAGAFYNIGTAKYELKIYDEAIEYLNKAIELNPNYSEFYNNRGNIQKILNNIENSIEDFDKAIELNPNYSEAYNNIALLQKKCGYYSDALKYINLSIKLKPNLPESYNNRAMIKLDLADDNYQKFLMNNNYMKSYIYLYNYYSEIKESSEKLLHREYKEILEDLNIALKLNSKYENAYINAGIVKSKLKMYDEAIKDFEKAIELNPNNYNIYENRALTKSYLENYNGAIEDYDKAIELKPQDSKLYFDRYIVKQILLKNKDSEEYKKFFDDVYNDLDTAYNLANKELKEIIKNKIINIAIQKNEVAIKFCENKGLNIKDIIIYIEGYISKSLLLSKITDEDSEEYKKYFEDAYNDLDTAYNLADEQLKEIIKEKLIYRDKSGNEVAIKFCEDKGWDIK